MSPGQVVRDGRSKTFFKMHNSNLIHFIQREGETERNICSDRIAIKKDHFALFKWQ